MKVLAQLPCRNFTFQKQIEKKKFTFSELILEDAHLRTPQ